jgi:flagellar protein FlaJ
MAGATPSDLGGATRPGLLGRVADRVEPLVERGDIGGEDFVQNVDDALDAALRDDPVEVFIARAVALGLLVGIALAAAGVAVGYLVGTLVLAPSADLLAAPLPEPLVPVAAALQLPLLVLLTALLLGAVGFAAGFAAPIATVYYTADDRAREIEMLLPDAVAYMYALSVGGMNQLEIFQAVADSEDVYGEVSREFQAMMQETSYFDTDYRTAMRNRAIETPSDSLSGFLTDSLSIIDSGGDMTQFLSDKTEKHMREAKQTREGNLETLELFGEMYMTVSLFPLLLVILLVIMSMMGKGSPTLMLLSVYGLVPGIAVAFVVLIAMVKQDERGGGRLSMGDVSTTAFSAETTGTFERPVTETYVEADHRLETVTELFERVHRREGRHRVAELLRQPHELFIRKPTYTLALTVPLAILAFAGVYTLGLAPLSWSGFKNNPVSATALYVYLPLYVVTVPLALARYGQRSRRRAVLDRLAESLRKLSSANDTGLTLLESFRNVASTTTGRLSREFDRIHGKVQYGASLKAALVEFNNRYEIPRMARTVNLIAEAQEASSQISDVLRTAAAAAENQDDIERDRKTRTRMQIAIIVMTYLVLLGVMALLKVQFLEAIAELVNQAASSESAQGPAAIGSGLDIDRLSMLFFHTVTLQAISAAIIAGYLRESRLLGSVKYLVALPTVALVTWVLIG